MGMYSAVQGKLDDWVHTRTADLREEWVDAIYVLTEFQGFGHYHEFDIRLDDAANRQARAERFAYIRSEPVPDVYAAFAELLAWIRSRDFKCTGEWPPGLPMPKDDRIAREVEPIRDAAMAAMEAASQTGLTAPIPWKP